MSRPPASYTDLKAVFVNCTLKRSPQTSNTQGLMTNAQAIMEKQGVSVETIRLVDHDVAQGVQPDMTEHGWDRDAWPDLWKIIKAADILVVGTPIWLGEESSAARTLIERLYAHSGDQNEDGQYVFYGKVGACMVTGNEDGVKHVSMGMLYALQHVGYTIPPQADSGWIGEIGPGKSYLDEGSGGPDNDFTRRNTTFMTWNLLHLARMLKDAGGIPPYGNQIPAWNDGERFGHPPAD
ncbi:flavodoxin family protein [Marinicauda sp. Alg238-R41]|uniref:flavodoxin family protein n=1 Tax=Marinicauda sp. Alg238-R41 TaxID=2993447 RepID=UPI0022E1D58C|nr:flavodoxin family protein [Marinicauda sp. Alg238-R41]